MRTTLSVLAVAAAAFLSIPAASQAAPLDAGLQAAVRGAGALVDAQIYIGPGGVGVYPERGYREPGYRGRGYGHRRAYGYRSGYRQPQCRRGWTWQSGQCKPYRGY